MVVAESDSNALDEWQYNCIVRTLRTVAIVVTLSLTCFGACPSSAKCPYDDSQSSFTGKTEMISGHLWGTYKCFARGHEFKVRCD